MAKTIQEEFLHKKAYEFSYAVSRIALSAKNKEIAGLMENKAFSLLNSVLIADYGETREILHSILSITGLMVDSGILNPINRDILMRESESVYSAIDALPIKKEILPDLNLNRLFSKSVLPIKRSIADKPSERQPEKEIADINIADKSFADGIADKNQDESNSFKSEVRQSAIIAKLQEKENCRLNELQDLFPNISERTLRYDLESLVSSGLVERMGSRRNSFYRIKGRSGGIIELPSATA